MLRKLLKFKRKILNKVKLKYLKCLFLATLGSVFLFAANQYGLFYFFPIRPYYLVDEPNYVFIDNDQMVKGDLFRPHCSPFNDPIQENPKVKIGNELYPKIIPLHANRIYNFTCLDTNSYRPLILVWNKFNGLPIYEVKEGRIDSKHCPVTSCLITHDRSKLNESAYVLFHMRAPIDEFPRVRFSRQKWVYIIYESQQNCPMCTKLVGYFNLSSTYRHDSDITSVYYGESGLGWSSEPSKESEEEFNRRFLFDTRPNFVAALISDCSDNVHRIDYINELHKHVRVDMFGKCSGVPCPKEDSRDPFACRLWIARTYKFFLAFENSACEGYITEKFFLTLRYDILPVVFGAGHYTRYIPKSAYINAMDYPNPADLGAYLSYLASNQTAYNEYFAWKRYLRLDEPQPAPLGSYLCEMCIRLQLELFAPNALEKIQFNDHSQSMDMKKTCYGVRIERTASDDRIFHYVKGKYLKMRFY